MSDIVMVLCLREISNRHAIGYTYSLHWLITSVDLVLDFDYRLAFQPEHSLYRTG